MRQVTALFGLVCLAGALLAPILGIVLLVTGGGGPAFSDETHEPGQEIRLVRPTTVWAQPASVDVSAVTCTASEFGGTGSAKLQVGKPSSGPSIVDRSTGDVRFLTTTSRADFSVGTVSCTGGGITAILTARDSGAVHKQAGIAFLVATPILLAIGLGVRRAGFRV